MLARRPSGGRTAAVLAVLALVAGPAGAAEVKLSAAEITSLLAGNSVTGEFRGAGYIQYFKPDGNTVRISQGAPPEEGRWKADRDKNQYCSWWISVGWRCYDVTRDGDTLYWQKPDAAHRSESTWAEGNLLPE